MVNIAGGKSRRSTLDDKATNAILSSGPDNGHVSDATVGDPHLGTVQDIRVTISTRRRLHVVWIATGIRFGKAEATDDFPRGHLRQPALLLLLRAKRVYREHGQ